MEDGRNPFTAIIGEPIEARIPETGEVCAIYTIEDGGAHYYNVRWKDPVSTWEAILPVHKATAKVLAKALSEL